MTVGGGAEVGGACMEMEHDLQHPAQNPAQPAPAAPAPGSPHSLHWVTLSREQRAGEQESCHCKCQAGELLVVVVVGTHGPTLGTQRHRHNGAGQLYTRQHATSAAHNLQTFIQSSLLSAAITITAAARAVRPPNTTDMSYNLPSRAGNKPSQSWKFYNHGKGYY